MKKFWETWKVQATRSNHYDGFIGFMAGGLAIGTAYTMRDYNLSFWFAIYMGAAIACAVLVLDMLRVLWTIRKGETK